ncbi:MAG TPA: AI-2E family transporter [Verrucomicrobiae bacterium]|jgi:predicted PurR-regulated permease PerM
MNFPPPTEKQARVIWTAAAGLAVAIILALFAGFVWGLGVVLHLLGPVLWPIAVAGILAYLLDPVVDFLERRRLPRARAILCVFGVATAVAVGVIGSIVPQVVRETQDLVAKVPEYAVRLQQRVEDWVNHPPPALRHYFERHAERVSATNAVPAVTPAPPGAPVEIDWGRLLGDESVKSATEWLAKSAARAARWLFGQFSLVTSFFGVVVGLALVPVYAFYFLLEKKGIQRRWTDYLPVRDSGFKDELVFVLRSINDYLIVFFRGQVLVAMCDGALYTIGFLLVGVPYALLIGVIATVLTMIPFVGAITTCVLALTMSLVQYGDWQHPLMVLAVFAVVQALEGLAISPRIIGNRVGLHPLMIIIAVLAGTTLLGGLLGGILAIPLTAALRVILDRYVWKKSAGSTLIVGTP